MSLPSAQQPQPFASGPCYVLYPSAPVPRALCSPASVPLLGPHCNYLKVQPVPQTRGTQVLTHFPTIVVVSGSPTLICGEHFWCLPPV